MRFQAVRAFWLFDMYFIKSCTDLISFPLFMCARDMLPVEAYRTKLFPPSVHSIGRVPGVTEEYASNGLALTSVFFVCSH